MTPVRLRTFRENQSIIEAQAEGAKMPVVHVDPIKREDLIQHLKTAPPERRDSIEWLLERSVWGTAPTYGIARNLALLLGAGKRALVLMMTLSRKLLPRRCPAPACSLAPPMIP